MVRKGEYLERAVVLPGTPALEGLYHRGTRGVGVVILPPEPERGGMEIPLVAEIAWAVTRRGHPSVRVNYPGVGASEGRYDQAGALEAARRAAEHLRACLDAEPPDKVALGFVGVGQGAVWALDTAEAGADLFLVQPSPDIAARTPPPTGQVVVVSAAQDDPQEIEARRSWVQASGSGRAMVVPEADTSWRRHLVVVGQSAAELFSPPGEFDFGD